MMTPEQIERNMEFILESQANSAVRMDRLEANMGRLERRMDAFQDQMVLFQEKLDHQRENIDGLMQLGQKLLIINEAELARIRRLEERMGGVEELTRLLREWVESNLRPPDHPPSKSGN